MLYILNWNFLNEKSWTLRLRWSSLVGNILWALWYIDVRMVITWLHSRGQWKLCIWYIPHPPNSALWVSSLADFNLYPFLVVNHDHEYKSYLWIVWVLQANYKPGSGLGHTLKLPLVLEVRKFLGIFPINTAVGWISLLLVSVAKVVLYGDCTLKLCGLTNSGQTFAKIHQVLARTCLNKVQEISSTQITFSDNKAWLKNNKNKN